MQSWAGADLGSTDWPGEMEQVEQLEQEWNELRLAGAAPDPEEVFVGIEDEGVDAESCCNPPREERSHPPGRRWGVPHGSTEPRPQQIQITNEVLTILAEAALEHRIQRRNKNFVVARGQGSKLVQMGLAQASRQGILAGTSKTKVRYLGAA